MRKDWTDILRNRMAGYKVEPSVSVWEKVWKRISDSKAITIATSVTGVEHLHIRSYISWISVAAAVLAAVFTATYIYQGKRTLDDTDAVAIVAKSDTYTANTQQERIEATSETVPNRKATVTNQKNTGKDNYTARILASNSAVTNQKNTGEDNTVSGQDKNSETVYSDIAPNESKKSTYTTDNEDDFSVHQDFPTDNEDFPTNDDDRSYYQRNRRSVKVSIAAVGGGSADKSFRFSSANVLGANPLSANVTGLDWSANDNQRYIVFNSPEIESKYIHKIPVRIGFNIQYDLIPELGIETGLSYSLLSSIITTGTEGAGHSYSKGDQTLHYIGIPVSLVWNYLDRRFVTSYIKAGGMAEKSVRGSLHTDEYIAGKHHSSYESKVTPKEIQWSANAAVGVQANILPALGFFFEPGIVYRFDSGSTVRSVYTDKAFDFSIGFGLRYRFD